MIEFYNEKLNSDYNLDGCQILSSANSREEGYKIIWGRGPKWAALHASVITLSDLINYVCSNINDGLIFLTGSSINAYFQMIRSTVFIVNL